MLEKIRNIFILGIKGVAMANLALILSKMGKKIYGWDRKEEFITKPVLDSLSTKIFTNKFLDLKLIKETDLIIYSAAHQGDKNPLLEQFNQQIPRLHQIEALGKIMKKFSFPIAVAGSHGKTTTSSLLAYALINLKQKPSYLVGTSSFTNYFGGDYHPHFKTKYFVAEADEYGLNPPYNLTPKFYFLDPKIIITTNIDFDHPDVYQNLKDVEKAFLNFFNKRVIIACGDNLSIKRLLKKFDRKQYLLYGFSEDNDYQIKHWLINKTYSQFDIYHKNKKIDTFKIKIFGSMNISNTTAVILTLNYLGFFWNKIKKAIEGFTGAKRRFEEVYRYKNTFLFDDYAHHPSEIQKTIEAAHQRFPKKRVVVIFQPHTYSRTQILSHEFNQSLSKAGLSIILPIFPSARERPENFNFNSEIIINANHKNNLFYLKSKRSLVKFLKGNITTNDIIFTMGAGDVYQLKEVITPVIKSIR